MAVNKIAYVNGDATAPAGLGPMIIAHVCNDIGAWGRGFVLALGRRYPEAEQAYRAWYQADKSPYGTSFKLGEIELVLVGDHVWVANMIAQRGIMPSEEGIMPIRYEALGRCLKTLSREARDLGATIHMPRIGCGLAGGSWHEIESIIHRELIETDVLVTVYDYEGPGAEVVPWQK